ncbi:MAG: hypothetical protein IRZ14_17185 [Chloroflexi bacterium]|nr:hypothetical protein [Chloroflexota bacterium]
MNKRKRVAWRKHRIKAKKREERRRALPTALRQPTTRRAGGAAPRGS